MKLATVLNHSREVSLGDRVAIANTRWTRLRGLLGRPEPQEGEGLLIVPSRGVHMMGMRYALDVVLLDGAGTVVALYPELPPWGKTRMHRGARVALELPAGSIARTGTRTGDLVDWSPAERTTPV